MAVWQDDVPWGPMVDINLICFLSFPLANKSDILQQHQHWKLILFLQVPPAGSNGGSGSESSEERRKKVARHISIDETPITHTYHQNSLETSSQSSHSPSEVTLAPPLMTRSCSAHHIRQRQYGGQGVIMGRTQVIY